MIYFLMAGESSGDRLGANLMAALKTFDRHAQFHGVGGELMAAQGIVSLFPLEDINMVGFTSVIYHIRHLYARINLTANAINGLKPDAVISIDSSDFAIRVRHRIAIDTVCIHYVAPIVWIVRKKRARVYAQAFDAILTLMPFEPPYFNRTGGNAIFVGHDMFSDNMLRNAAGRKIRDSALAKAGSDAQKNPLMIGLLPGSRYSEIQKLLPIFIKTAKQILKTHPATVFVMVSFEKFQHVIQPAIENLPIHLVSDENQRFDAMQACDIALAASGTVTLHLSVLKVPYIVAYRFDWLNWLFWRLWVKKINLFNLIAKSDIIEEYIQHHCQPQKLAKALLRLATPEAQNEHLQKLTPWIESFRPPKEHSQNHYAAHIALSVIRENANSRESPKKPPIK